MRVTVIVVTYNGSKWVEKCFESLTQSSIKLDVIAIDNNSIDCTVDLIKEKYPSVTIIETGKNLGFGKANNIGINIAIDNNSDYIYLMNQDAWVENNSIENLIKIQQKNPIYGIISPMQMNCEMTRIDKRLSVLCSEKHCPGLISDLYVNNLRDVYDISSVMAAHWLISKKCFMKIGGFAKIFKHYGEDDNYLNRVVYHGFRIGICPSVKAVHDRETRIKTLDSLVNGLEPLFLALSCNVNKNVIQSLILGFSFYIYKSIEIVNKSHSFNVLINLIIKPFILVTRLPLVFRTRRLTKKGLLFP